MRKKKTIKNFLTSIIPFFLIMIISFWRLDIFLEHLGVDVYALNQLFYQIFVYLSLVEGGFGAIILQKFYKNFSTNNVDAINNTYTSAKTLFKRIALIMFIAGFVLSFFINFLVNNSLDFHYVQLVFILFLSKNIIDYLMMAPRFVLDGDQSMYKINIQLNVFKILEAILEIGLLLLGFGYVIVLINSIIIRYLSNLYINRKIFKFYPWLKEVENYKKIESRGLGDTFAIRISGALYYNIDIVLLSIYQSSFMVTVYSNYNYVVKMLTDIIFMLATSMTASFANVIHKEKIEESFKIFKEINTIFCFIGLMVAIIFFYSANSFISLWVGEEYIIETFSLFLMSIYLYFSIYRRAILIAMYAYGDFKDFKNSFLLEAFLNFLISIVLVKFMGISGLLIGTVISSLLTTFITIPNKIYSKIFKEKSSSYYLLFLCNLCIFFSVIFLTNNFTNLPININIFSWIFNVGFYSLIIGSCLFCFYYLSNKDFKNSLFKMLSIIKK
ncbi:MAG: lipopolysaccharide biosynthesis protein [Bacilli bacterium]